MTLIAAQIDGNRLCILADGLSCHDKLTITPSRRIGANSVQTAVPGRTTLQKIFPHPHLAFAIAHCGSNQRHGVPIRTIVERFWQRTVSEQCQPGAWVQLFEEEFDGAASETLLLLGWQSPCTAIVHVLGTDYERLDSGRYWAGSGRNLLSRSWSDLDSLQETAERFLGKGQKQAPFALPFFANCFGGHWHRLQLTVGQSPQWLIEPRRTGVEVSSLLPGSSRQTSGDNPSHEVTTRGERLKKVLREVLKVATVRGALKRITVEDQRERVARLMAIFDEVQLDSGIAVVEDARRYATAVDDAVVRLIEREMLDQHHRQYALLSRNKTVAVQVLLRCYAQILRDLRTGKIPKPSDDSKSQTANEGLRGLAQCLRWISERCPSRLVVPTPTPDVLAQEALDLLRWGVAYDPVWNQHSAYSRGLIDVEVDGSSKSIAFLPQRGVHPHYFCTQVEAKKADDERLGMARPDSQLAVLSKAWYDSVRVSQQGMHFDDAAMRESGAIDVACSWMEKACLPELDDATSLMSCTVRDLRRLLATLYVYSLFVTKLEDVGDDQPTLDVVIQPTIVARRRDQMIDWLAELSGVSAPSVDAILSVITFDPTHPHVTLAQQPFVSLDDEQLLFLPRMLLFLDLPRMYVGAINKDGRGRAVYAQAINKIESVGVESIASEIRAQLPSSLHIVASRTFRLPDGREITPDTVITSEHDRVVLVIDVKYATPPFGPADIHRDMDEMVKWETQMTDYVTSFENNPDVLIQHLPWAGTGCARVAGLILTRWPFPVPVHVAERVGAVDWPSLKEHMQTVHFSSLQDLMTWAINRPDIRASRSLAWKAKEVQVGEWIYRYSVLTPLEKERVFDLTQKLAFRLWQERGRPLWGDQRDWFDAERHLAANPHAVEETAPSRVVFAHRSQPGC